MNNIAIMGRLVRDPELRHTTSNIPVSSFTLAVDRGRTPKGGGEKETDFIDVIAWRGTAEFVSKWFSKGQPAAVVGRLQIRDWKDKDGNKRRSAEVIAESVYFAGGKKASGNSKGDLESASASEFADFADIEVDDAELPF